MEPGILVGAVGIFLAGLMLGINLAYKPVRLRLIWREGGVEAEKVYAIPPGKEFFFEFNIRDDGEADFRASDSPRAAEVAEVTEAEDEEEWWRGGKKPYGEAG
jgi:hypothetical protein